MVALVVVVVVVVVVAVCGVAIALESILVQRRCLHRWLLQISVRRSPLWFLAESTTWPSETRRPGSCNQ